LSNRRGSRRIVGGNLSDGSRVTGRSSRLDRSSFLSGKGSILREGEWRREGQQGRDKERTSFHLGKMFLRLTGVLVMQSISGRKSEDEVWQKLPEPRQTPTKRSTAVSAGRRD
jgi:hypothetical protein